MEMKFKMNDNFPLKKGDIVKNNQGEKVIEILDFNEITKECLFDADGEYATQILDKWLNNVPITIK